MAHCDMAAVMPLRFIPLRSASQPRPDPKDNEFSENGHDL